MDDYINAIDEYLDSEHSFNRFYELTVKEIKNACTRVKAGIDRFWRAIKRLQKISNVGEEQFIGNEDLINASKRDLQVAIKATIDVSEVLIAYMRWRTPRSYKEICTILLENKIKMKH
jgi:uncharacterized protein YutE (UPF0331/DUF86 family)